MRLYFFSLIAIIAITMILPIVMKVKDKSNAVHEGFSVVMFTFLDYVALMFYVSLNLLVIQTNWLGMILLPILFIILVFLVSFFYDNVFIKNAHLKDLTGANRNLCNLSAMIYVILYCAIQLIQNYRVYVLRKQYYFVISTIIVLFVGEYFDILSILNGKPVFSTIKEKLIEIRNMSNWKYKICLEIIVLILIMILKFVLCIIK